MENQEIIITITILAVLAYFYWQNRQESLNTLSPENDTKLKELKNQVQHYQKLYQDRVKKDLAGNQTQEIQQLNQQLEQTSQDYQEINEELIQTQEYNQLYQQKITDLENSLLNLAKQKLKGKKDAEKLLAELESNWKQEKQAWEKKYQQVNEVLVSQRNLVITQDKKITSLEQKLAQQEEANQKQRKLIVDLSKKKPTPDSEATIQELKQEQQEKLRKINVLFDDKAANYERIDFEGLNKLLENVSQEKKEMEERTKEQTELLRKLLTAKQEQLKQLEAINYD